MDLLRLILLLVGLVILAAMVLLHRPAGASERNYQRWLERFGRADGARRGKTEPSLGGGSESRVDPGEERAASTANLAAGLASARIFARDEDAPSGPDTDAVGSPARRQSEPDKIVTLYVQRREGRRINGPELRDAADKAGLSFGEMNIFHRLQEGATEPVFSVANLTAPGHFDPDSWHVFDTPGLTMFLTLPAPVSALDAWDAMLATGRRLGELLEAEVLDDGHCLVTRQRIAQVREDMREYDRRKGLGHKR